jgi:hypothetical protein
MTYVGMTHACPEERVLLKLRIYYIPDLVINPAPSNFLGLPTAEIEGYSRI